MRNFTYPCMISILLLSPLLGHCIGKNKVSLFNNNSFDRSPCQSQTKGIFNTTNASNFEHTPVQNPGGTQFELDSNFVIAYQQYEARNKKTEIITTKAGKEINAEEVESKFTLYKLAGATQVDTSDSGWEVDYIAPPKSSTQKAIDAAQGMISEFIPDNPKEELSKLTDKTLSSISKFNDFFAKKDEEGKNSEESNKGIFDLKGEGNIKSWFASMFRNKNPSNSSEAKGKVSIFELNKNFNSIFDFYKEDKGDKSHNKDTKNHVEKKIEKTKQPKEKIHTTKHPRKKPSITKTANFPNHLQL